jgi:hypothetical protein
VSLCSDTVQPALIIVCAAHCCFFIIYLSVALVVKTGVCSYESKALYASKYIYPPGVVKYLIIDGDIHYDDYYDAPEFSVSSSLPQFVGEGRTDYVILDEEPEPEPSPTTPRGLRKTNYDMTVSILHVSYGVGFNLLETILRETKEVTAEGGTRILMTADSPPASRATVVLWFGLCFLMACSACCCLASSINGLLEATLPQENQPVRPRRRRLTTEQVRTNIPMGVFDGNQLVFAAIDDEEEDDLLISDNRPTPHSLDACTICLDDYTPGDKLRCLPCHHTFHAKCIGKWLTERSATCPLCKIDLYESEDEEAIRPVDPTPNRHLMSSWASVPPEAATTTATTAQPTMTTTEDDEQSWWRRGWFGRNVLSTRRQRERQRRRETAAAVSAALTQPLLSSEEPPTNDVPSGQDPAMDMSQQSAEQQQQQQQRDIEEIPDLASEEEAQPRDPPVEQPIAESPETNTPETVAMEQEV